MANTNELDYSRKAADGERLELIMRQVASRFKLDGNVLAEALLDIHERLKAVEGATEELTSSDRWKAFKTVQLVKPSPSASGDTVTAIDTVAQDENGELTATKKNIRQGTTSQTGIVQLSDATNSTSTVLAATANAVKTAYDLAASKQDALGISSSGSATKFLNEQGGWATVTIPDVSGKLDKDGLGDDVRVEFTEAANRTNITTGSKLSTLFGQIRKWFADMGALAFKDTVGASDVESDTYPISISGNAATATTATTADTASTLSASGITSGDLDDYRSGGKRYFCNAGNSSNVSNKPSGVTGAFALDVIAHSGGITQRLYNRDSNYSYIRCYTGSKTWTSWDRLSLVSDASFSAVNKSENTADGCTLTFTAIDGSTKSVTVRNVVTAGNADTVNGYYIVVGSTGTDSNTIYFT